MVAHYLQHVKCGITARMIDRIGKTRIREETIGARGRVTVSVLESVRICVRRGIKEDIYGTFNSLQVEG